MLPDHEVGFSPSIRSLAVSWFRSRASQAVSILLISVAAFSFPLVAQENNSPTFHSQTTVVLVPTLVTDQHGEVIYGLTQRDFVIEDNGVERAVKLDDTFSAKPVSMILAVQNGGSAPAALGSGCALRAQIDEFRETRCRSTLHEIGSMLETFVDAPGSEMALVSFDSEVKLRRDFTTDIPKVDQALDALPAGDYGNATLDAIHYSLNLLKQRPGNRRKILIVVSEQADQDSKTITLDEAARQIIASDVELYMIAFPADAKAKLESVAKLFGPLVQQELLREEVAGRPHGGWRGGEHGGSAGGGAGSTSAAGVPHGGGGAGGGGLGKQGQAGAGATSSATSSTAAQQGAEPQADGGSGDGTAGATGSGQGLTAASEPGVEPSDSGESSGARYGLGPRNVNIGGPIFSLLKWSASQMHTDVPQAVTNLTGGEYILFHNAQGLDQALGMLANHAHNRYQLSFQVKDPTPGPHTIRVFLRDGSGALIWARAGYWPTVNPSVARTTTSTSVSHKNE